MFAADAEKADPPTAPVALVAVVPEEVPPWQWQTDLQCKVFAHRLFLQSQHSQKSDCVDQSSSFSVPQSN